MCTETLTCTEFHRSWWMQMRDHTNSIIAYMRRHSFPYKDVELSNEQLLSSQYSLKLRPMLCKEEQSAGFLLDSRSESWPIRCLWTGNDLNATCAPAPPRNSSIYYIAPNVWRKQVREFRQQIGCNIFEIEKANKLDELYVCKERCLQAGISWIPSVLIVASLLVSFTLILLT